MSRILVRSKHQPDIFLQPSSPLVGAARRHRSKRKRLPISSSFPWSGQRSIPSFVPYSGPCRPARQGLTSCSQTSPKILTLHSRPGQQSPFRNSFQNSSSRNYYQQLVSVSDASCDKLAVLWFFFAAMAATWTTTRNQPDDDGRKDSTFSSWGVTLTRCDEEATETKKMTITTTHLGRKKSPEVVEVRSEDVQALVDILLQDPDVNIRLLPDVIESRLYHSTILLTIHAMYSALQQLEGLHILSHEVHIHFAREHQDSSTQLYQALMDEGDQEANNNRNGRVNKQVLQEIAQSLLRNPVIRSPWIPDAIEEQIYTSCLQVIFRVIQMVLRTFKIKLCGHDLTMALEFDWEAAAQRAAENNSTGPAQASIGCQKHHRMTPIDLDLLQHMAHESGVDDETNPASWWDRVYLQSDFVRQLHISLYGLVLALLDDLLLGQMKIQILSDTIEFDLVAPSSPPNASGGVVDARQDAEDEEIKLNNSESTRTRAHSSSGVVSFAAGVGVGAALVTILSKRC